MKLIPSGKAAEVLGVHRNTLFEWDRLGLLKPDLVTPRGHRRYSAERLLRELSGLGRHVT